MKNKSNIMYCERKLCIDCYVEQCHTIITGETTVTTKKDCDCEKHHTKYEDSFL